MSAFRAGDRLVLLVDSDSWWYRRPFFYWCAEDRRLPRLVTREAGAANEALSDVIATAVEYSVHSPNQGNLRGDWQIGEDLGEVIRDLQNPSRLRLDRDNRAPHYPHRFPSVYSAVVRFVPLHVPGGQWEVVLGCPRTSSPRMVAARSLTVPAVSATTASTGTRPS